MQAWLQMAFYSFKIDLWCLSQAFCWVESENTSKTESRRDRQAKKMNGEKNKETAKCRFPGPLQIHLLF